MDRQEALVALREVMVEVLAVDPALVTEDANFRDDLSADSLDLVEVVMALEDRLGVRFRQDGFKGLVTVGQALDRVLDDGQAPDGA